MGGGRGGPAVGRGVPGVGVGVVPSTHLLSTNQLTVPSTRPWVWGERPGVAAPQHPPSETLRQSRGSSATRRHSRHTRAALGGGGGCV